eukprot:5997937-Pyramimonas_sp.AAC.2
MGESGGGGEGLVHGVHLSGGGEDLLELQLEAADLAVLGLQGEGGAVLRRLHLSLAHAPRLLHLRDVSSKRTPKKDSHTMEAGGEKALTTVTTTGKSIVVVD